MKRIIFNVIQKIFNIFGYKIINKKLIFSFNFQKLSKNFFNKFCVENFISYVCENQQKASSQIFQDLFVDYCLKKKRKGFYCEVGAADGVKLSNTFFLEKKREWRGILCEPSNFFFKKLKKNRSKKNYFVKKAIDFNNADKRYYPASNPFLGGLKKSDFTNKNKDYLIKCATLDSIFSNYKIKNFDYLSIDTEGNEINVLKGLNLNKFRPSIITIEHNYKNEKKIHNLLSEYSYERVFSSISRFDAYYVCKKYLKKRWKYYT